MTNANFETLAKAYVGTRFNKPDKQMNTYNATCNERNSLRPVWKRAFHASTTKYEFMEIPVLANRKEITLYSFNPKKPSPGEAPGFVKNSFQRVLLYSNNDGKSFREAVLTYMPDVDYSRKNNAFECQITTLKDRKYSGLIEYRTSDGNVFQVLRFDDGVVKFKKLFRKKQIDKLANVKGAGAKTMTSGSGECCEDYWAEICVYYGCPEVEDCSVEYQGCIPYECPEPPPGPPGDPCDDPANFHICYPENPGGGGGGDGGPIGGGGTTVGTNFNPADVYGGNGNKPLFEYANKCSGVSDMWNNYPSNEVFGYISKDGKLIITDIQPYSGGTASGLYKHEGSYYYTFPDTQGAPVENYQGMVHNSSSGQYFIPVAASIHTHTPCRSDGSDGIQSVGSEDRQFANTFPNISHWVIGCDAVGEYNGYSDNYFNKSHGIISQTCGSIH